MSRVLLDQGLSPHAAQLLRQSGWHALHVTECALDRAQDSEILEYALQHSFICVTLDHDFHTHLARAKALAPSVVFVRVEGLNSNAQVELIQRVWESCEEALRSGAVVSVGKYSLRVRQLPLRPASD